MIFTFICLGMGAAASGAAVHLAWSRLAREDDPGFGETIYLFPSEPSA